ncbi:hypothetical protein EC988_002595 [Linderina pennispora]|nr:hypothetical protein EC988_002595 [Linderina pennispora]
MKVVVPRSISLDRIDECLSDMHSEFVHVDDPQPAIEAELTTGQPFIVLGMFDFTVYNAPGGHVRCSYQSRNYVTMIFSYTPYLLYWWWQLDERGGVLIYDEPPLVYFVHESSRGALYENAMDYNSVVVYFTERNIAEFARITRVKRMCNVDVFIVYMDGVYECFETGDTGSMLRFGERVKDKVIEQVRKDAKNLRALRNTEEKLDMRCRKRRRVERFRLMDQHGHMVQDGVRFRLKVAGFRSGIGEDIAISFAGGEMTTVAGGGDSFVCETIDGIAYLKRKNMFVYCPGCAGNAIRLSPALPEKRERLQLHFMESGAVRLTKWDEEVFAHCVWAQQPAGCVIRLDDSPDMRRWGPAVELLLVT